MRYWAASLFLLLLDVTSFAQSYTIATYAGPGFPLNGTLATTQAIDFPYAVISDGNGGFYVSSYAPSRIYRVGTDGRMTLVAGSGIPGFSGDGGPATSAQINGPMGLARDTSGNLFFADSGNNRIREITPNGIINTVTGTSVAGFSGDGGPAAGAQLRTPRSVAVDPSGNVFIADASNARIRKIDAGGTINTFAGVGITGFAGDGGPAINAQIGTPEGIALDSAGNLFIAEPGNARVREVTADGIIHTIAGTGTPGFSGDGGPATSAQFNAPYAVAFDSRGNLLVADLNNNRVRTVSPSGVITTLTAQLRNPSDVMIDPSGNVFIADSTNYRVQKMSPAGVITSVAVRGTIGLSRANGAAIPARVNR